MFANETIRPQLLGFPLYEKLYCFGTISLCRLFFFFFLPKTAYFIFLFFFFCSVSFSSFFAALNTTQSQRALFSLYVYINLQRADASSQLVSSFTCIIIIIIHIIF